MKRKSRIFPSCSSRVSEDLVLYVMAKLDSRCVPGQVPFLGTIAQGPGLQCPTRGRTSQLARVRACTDHQTLRGSSPINRHPATLRRCSLLASRPRHGLADGTNPGDPDNLPAASTDPVHG